MHRRVLFCCSLVVAVLLGSTALKAQDYSKLLDQWDKINEQIDEAYEALRRSPADEREQARQDYVDLVNRANQELLPELRKAALEQYKEEPNEDKQLAKLLVGMAANDARHDEHEDVLQIGSVLIDHLCPVRAIYGLAGKSAYCLNDFDLAEDYLEKAKQAGALDFQGTQLLDDLETAKTNWTAEQEIRKQESEADDLPRVKITTEKGDLVLELFENEAPQAVANFIHLVEQGFYDGLTFHRVIGGFMAQAGCPKGDGSGDAGYKIHCECYQDNHRKHFRGSLSMAKSSDPDTREPLANSGGSQFFVTFRRTAELDGKYTVFGRLIEGWDVLPKLQRREQNPFNTQPLAAPDKIVKAEVLRKRDHPYAPTKILPETETDPPTESSPTDDPASNDPTSDDGANSSESADPEGSESP